MHSKNGAKILILFPAVLFKDFALLLLNLHYKMRRAMSVVWLLRTKWIRNIHCNQCCPIPELIILIGWFFIANQKHSVMTLMLLNELHCMMDDKIGCKNLQNCKLPYVISVIMLSVVIFVLRDDPNQRLTDNGWLAVLKHRYYALNTSALAS